MGKGLGSWPSWHQTGGRTGPANGRAVPLLPTLQSAGWAGVWESPRGGLPGPYLPCGAQPPQGL